MRHALDDPEPYTPRQARAAGQHAKSRPKTCVRQLRQSGLLSQRRIGRQPVSRQRDLWGAETADALPKAEQDFEEWQAAVEALLLVVDRYWREIAIAGLIVLGPI